MAQSLDQLLRRAGIQDSAPTVRKSRHGGSARRRKQLDAAVAKKRTWVPVHRPDGVEPEPLLDPVQKAALQADAVERDLHDLQAEALDALNARTERLLKARATATERVAAYIERMSEDPTDADVLKEVTAALAPAPREVTGNDVLNALGLGDDPLAYVCGTCGYEAHGKNEGEASRIYKSEHGNGGVLNCDGSESALVYETVPD